MKILAVVLLTLSTAWCKPIVNREHLHTDDEVAIHNHTDVTTIHNHTDDATIHTDGAAVRNHTDDVAGMHNHTDGDGTHNHTDDGDGTHNHTDDGDGTHNHTDGDGTHNHTDGDGTHNHNDSSRTGKLFGLTGKLISLGHGVNMALNYFLYQHGESPTAHTTEWSYCPESGSGPEHWPTMFPTCNGQRQSPIDLDKDSAKLENLLPIRFENYDSITAENTEVINNGHSVALKAVGSNRAKLSGGLFMLDYKFLKLHFHWGSEHTMEGERFPLEMHMIHVWRGLEHFDKSTPKDPTQIYPGLGVCGFLFKISPKDNEDLTPLINVIASITEPGSKTMLEKDLSIPDLISPALHGGVFTYSGSLTTPTCDEVVFWSVFETALEISEAQLAAFMNVKNSHDKPMKDNYRPVQPLNHRNVAYFNNK